jgi:arginyl-tRNA synthetase
MTPLKDDLARLLAEALLSIECAVAGSDITASFETPKEEKFGDLSTNLVMRLAREKKTAPRPLAEKFHKRLEELLPASPLKGRIARIAVEGPGFVNFHYSPQEIASVVLDVKARGSSYGKPSVEKKNILLEYVSANPTGPLTVAHGRQAALGDSLARILRFCGHTVTTEYYNNDEGVQINTLGKSLFYRLRELLEEPVEPMPEEYYKGDYLVDIAKEFIAKEGAAFQSLPEDEKLRRCRFFARETIMAGIKKDLIDFDVTFDAYYSQEALGKSGKVEATLEELKKRGMVFENEGAVWLKSTQFGDDKDRVLIKSDKNYTYLTPDIAYHHEKFLRGFEMLIDILGPDHHGYIARLKASQKALGHDPDAVNVLIAQLVTLYENGQQVRMSTRAGEFVTLREILDEVGKDAGRFFFLMRRFDAHLDFDLALAKSQTPDNPVFYIQYAHARIESVKDKHGVKARWDSPADLARLTDPLETRVMRALSQFEESVLGANKTLEPFRLVPYLTDLAATFHRFYAENRVVTEDAALTNARLMLSEAVQQVLRNGLGLLGVTAPLKM